MSIRAPVPTWRGIGRSAAWGVGDQAISSLTNFALGLVIARSVPLQDFGAFTLAFATYTLVLGVSRALSTEPLAIRYSTGDEMRRRAASRSAGGAALLVGAVSGAGCVAAGLVLRGTTGTAFLLLGTALPGLLLQDAWRFVFFVAGQGGRAFLNDLIWAAAIFPSLAMLIASDHKTVGWLMLAWGGSAALAAVAGIFQSGVTPAPRGVRRWAREQRDLVPRLVGTFGASAGVAQISLYGVGALAGLAAVGTIRAANLLLGPIQMILIGVGLVAVPLGGRILRESPGRLPVASLILSTVLVLAVLLWGTALMVLPSRLGIEILGPTWREARGVLLPATLGLAALAAVMGPGYGLRVLAAAKRILRTTVTVAPLQIVGTVGGAAVGGVQGAIWGLAAAAWIGVPVWWWTFRSAVIEAREEFPLEEPPFLGGAPLEGPV